MKLERFLLVRLHEGSATARLGVRDFEIHWISSGFRISEWISGFQSGFLDFKVDFWISKRISGFQSGSQLTRRRGYLSTTPSQEERELVTRGSIALPATPSAGDFIDKQRKTVG